MSVIKGTSCNCILIAGMPLGSPMIWGCYGNKGAFLYPLGPQSKTGNKSMTFFLLFSYILKLLSSKREFTLKGLNLRTENALAADFHTKAAAAEPIDYGPHGEVYSASGKTDPLEPDFCHINNVLATWQQSAPESEKVRWVNMVRKLNEQ